MEKGWTWPPTNYVKVNLHVFFLTYILPNGNDSDIEVVIKDHRGTIVKMYIITIRNRTKNDNEL